MGPLARVRHSDVKDGLVIRVEITTRHRQVLMASHTLEKVQLDAGVGHPGQRRVSQGGPLLARTGPGCQSLQRRTQRLDDRRRTPPPALGLLGDQAAGTSASARSRAHEGGRRHQPAGRPPH